MCVSALPSALSKHRTWLVLWQDLEGEWYWSLRAPQLSSGLG